MKTRAKLRKVGALGKCKNYNNNNKLTYLMIERMKFIHNYTVNTIFPLLIIINLYFFREEVFCTSRRQNREQCLQNQFLPKCHVRYSSNLNYLSVVVPLASTSKINVLQMHWTQRKWEKFRHFFDIVFQCESKVNAYVNDLLDTD